MVMPLNVFGIVIQLEFGGYAVDCLRRTMLMPLNVFGIIIQLEFDGYAVDCFRHNHST
jgi:hypothetical protein